MQEINVGRRDRAHLSFRRHPQFDWLLAQCLDSRGILRVERALTFDTDEEGDECYFLGQATIYAGSPRDAARYDKAWASDLILRLLSYERAFKVNAELS
jgi:hypothetical protein